MRNTIRGTAAIAILAAGWSGAVPAIEAGAGARMGTLGLFGAEVIVGVSDHVNLRVPFSQFKLDYTEKDDGVEYKGKLRLKTYGAQIDVHPFKGNFYLTAGLFANGNKLSLRARDSSGTEEYELGDNDVTFTSDPNDPLSIDGRVKFASSAPFVGLGWGNAIRGESDFYFRFELGALFQGSSKVRLDTSGSAIAQGTDQSFDTQANTPEAIAFRGLVEQERADLASDIDDAIKIYPSINIGLGYRFGK